MRNTGLSRVTVFLLMNRQRAMRSHGGWRLLSPAIRSITWGWLLLLGAEIPAAVRIGRGLILPHAGRGVIIHPNTLIGQDVTIYHRCTIGVRGSSSDAPRIGDGAYLGAHAVVLGDIEVGARSRIGAGAVVIRDVEAGTTVTGVPATKS